MLNLCMTIVFGYMAAKIVFSFIDSVTARYIMLKTDQTLKNMEDFKAAQQSVETPKNDVLAELHAMGIQIKD